jgi:putative PIN family toxin of toxin-antitoxin system
MDAPRIVIDTNVWGAAFRSKRGASWELAQLVTDGRLMPHVSVPLLFEHEKIFRREREPMGLESLEEASALARVIASLAEGHDIYFLWRTFVADPDDAHVFEAAVAARADYLVTFNKRDFPRADQFDIRLATPYEFLSDIGEM